MSDTEYFWGHFCDPIMSNIVDDGHRGGMPAQPSLSHEFRVMDDAKPFGTSLGSVGTSTSMRAMPSNPLNMARSVPHTSSKESEAARRMAAKADRARRSRQKRKAYISDLEHQLEFYQKQLAALQAEKQHAQASPAPAYVDPFMQQELEPDATTSFEDVEREMSTRSAAHKTVLAELRKLDDSTAGGLQRADYQRVVHLMSVLGDNSRTRETMIETLLEKVKLCALPGAQTRFTLWILCQDDSFYTTPSVFSALKQNLGITDEQAAMLIHRRSALKAHAESYRRLVLEITTFLAHLQEMVSTRRALMEKLIGIVGIVNAARIVTWVDRQTWCMELLNSLFDQYVQSSLQIDPPPGE